MGECFDEALPNCVYLGLLSDQQADVIRGFVHRHRYRCYKGPLISLVMVILGGLMFVIIGVILEIPVFLWMGSVVGFLGLISLIVVSFLTYRTIWATTRLELEYARMATHQ
jgi:hypothetical protein